MKREKIFIGFFLSICIGNFMPVYAYTAKENTNTIEIQIPEEKDVLKNFSKMKMEDWEALEEERRQKEKFWNITFSPKQQLEFNFYDQDIDELVHYLKAEVNSNFDLKDYKIIINKEQRLVEFGYMIGEFETDVSYVFTIEKDKAESLGIMNEPIKKKLVIPENLPSEEEVKQMAIDYYKFAETGYTVENQIVKKIYETTTNCAYYLVLTDYGISTGSEVQPYGCADYRYPIAGFE